jgi:signal transduction histidine kinase
MEKNGLERMKEEFISNISHELRTPLAIAKGSIELVLEDELSEEQRSILIRGRDNLEKLNRIVDDLIEIAQLEDNPKLNFEWVDVEALIAGCLTELAPKAASRGIRIKARCHRNLPSVVGDSKKLRKAFTCILDNAIKFNDRGGEVVIGTRLKPDQLEIIFADNGIGIPRNQRSRIFDAFYQVDSSSRRRYNGMGLGLAIANKIITLHEGKISVEGRKKRGSIFKVMLPLNRPVFRELKDKVYI